MKQLAAITFIVLLCTALGFSAADESADFSGTWVLDSKKSDPKPIPVTNLGAPGNAGGGMGGMGGGFPGAKSKAPQVQAEPVPLVIQHTGNTMRISNTANGMPIVETFELDKKEKVEMVPVPNSDKQGEKKTKISLKKNKFHVQEITSTPQTKNEIKKDFTLSDDGKDLTLKIKTTFQMGMMVNQTEQKLIYHKQ